MNEAFGVQLKRLRLAGGWTRSELGARVGIDPTYVTRIESGQRRPPSRHLVEALAEVLPFERTIDRDQFYAAAGLLPPGGWSPELTLVRDILANPNLHERGHRRFRQGMEELLRVVLHPPRIQAVGEYVPLHEREVASV